jgi:Uncharacterized conserved protein
MIKLLDVGKTSFKYLEDGMSIYEKRLMHYINYKRVDIPDIKNASSLSENQIKEKEGMLLLKNIGEGDIVILLDARGKKFSSENWARHLEKMLMYGQKDITFVIGGAYGFSSKIYERSNEMLSLSDMIFSHQIIRLIFLEQLYRAFTIIKGEPYHHG